MAEFMAVVTFLTKAFEVLMWILKEYSKWDEYKKEKWNTFMVSQVAAWDNLRRDMKQTFDEDKYKAQTDVAKFQRYEGYRNILIDLLSRGSGILDIVACTRAGIGAKADQFRPEIVAILVKDIASGERAQLIAKFLVDKEYV